MKKVTFLLASAILSSVALTGLVSCGGDGTSGGDDNIYDITYVEDENYTVTGLSAIGQEGSNITFDVTSNSVFYEIGDVLFNGEATTKDWFGYEFIMPDEDVEITVELIPVTSYDDEDDYLSWGSSVTDKISVAEDKTVSYPVTTSLPLFFDMTKFGYYNTEIDATFLSSNEEVIPTDALAFEPTKASGGNLLRGGSITVDLKKLNPGTASIYFRFDSNNADEAELIRTFTVTEYGTIELEYWDVEFTYDNRSDFSDLENIQIRFRDENFIYGNSVANEYQSFTLADLVEESFTLKYIIGHEYSISASHAIYDEDSGRYTVTALEIYDWMGTGSSSTGFNQIIDGVLTLVSLPTAPIEIVLS